MEEKFCTNTYFSLVLAYLISLPNALINNRTEEIERIHERLQQLYIPEIPFSRTLNPITLALLLEINEAIADDDNAQLSRKKRQLRSIHEILWDNRNDAFERWLADNPDALEEEYEAGEADV